MTFAPEIPHPDPEVFLSAWSMSAIGAIKLGQYTTQPTSGVWNSAGRAYFVPFVLYKGYTLQRFYWLNGATVGTDSFQAGVYTGDGNDELLVSSPRTLSAGTINQCAFATCSVVASGVTSGTSTTDATSVATASVTLKARPGLMYALAVVNTHATTANTVTAQTTGAALSFTSRSTTQWSGSTGRTTIFTAVPTTDVTDTITITTTSAQTATGFAWSLVAFTNVDTATTDGIVQQQVGTGSSTTPLATLSAFGSSNNATFGAHGGAFTSAAPGTNFIEVHDVTYATPTAGLQTEYYSANDTTVDATITSAVWGSCAVEVKSLGTTYQLQPGRYYMALHCTGTTATIFKTTTAGSQAFGLYAQSGLTAGLPHTATLTANTSTNFPVFGITNRASP